VQVGRVSEEAILSDIGGYGADPLACTLYSFPWGEPGWLEKSAGPYDWQTDLLRVIGRHLQSPFRFEPLRLAVSSGHGIGKSALIAMVLHWAMSTCDDCRCVVTANTESQLRTKTWPEVTRWFQAGINAHWWTTGVTRIQIKEKSHADTWRVDRETWSENNTEAFQGLHNKGKRIVLVYDEASAIPDKLWDVSEGAQTDEGTEIIWLAFGNPTQPSGRFQECFGRFKDRWVTRQIDSRTVPGTNKLVLDQWVAMWGEDSDFVRVRVRGEFPRIGSTRLISGEVVAAARKRNVGDQSRAWMMLSVDVARFGDDQTVIGWRQGLASGVIQKYRGLDTMETGARVVEIVKKLTPRGCVIDGDGLGAGVVDYCRLHLQDWMKGKPWFWLHEFHGSAAAADSFMYYNRRAEMWGRMRDWLETGSIPDDPELETDLTGPDYFHSAKNQIQLESKEDMKARGLASPDVGDMLAMTFSAEGAKKTQDEELAERIQATKDPLEQHFMRLAETERREKAKQPLNYWE
jgi:Helicase